MAVPTLEQIMGAIETRLETIPGLHVSDVSPGHILPPQAIVGVPPIPEYHTSLVGRRPTLQPTVTVYVGAMIDRFGQLQLAAYADPYGDTSIPAAIAEDKTLGGVVGDCMVLRFDPLGLEEIGLVGYFGGRFTLRVMT